MELGQRVPNGGLAGLRVEVGVGQRQGRLGGEEGGDLALLSGEARGRLRADERQGPEDPVLAEHRDGHHGDRRLGDGAAGGARVLGLVEAVVEDGRRGWRSPCRWHPRPDRSACRRSSPPRRPPRSGRRRSAPSTSVSRPMSQATTVVAAVATAAWSGAGSSIAPSRAKASVSRPRRADRSASFWRSRPRRDRRGQPVGDHQHRGKVVAIQALGGGRLDVEDAEELVVGEERDADLARRRRGRPRRSPARGSRPARTRPRASWRPGR